MTVAIVHTYIGDLKIDLVAPDGSAYTLHDRLGGSADLILRQGSLIALGSDPTMIEQIQEAQAALEQAQMLDQVKFGTFDLSPGVLEAIAEAKAAAEEFDCVVVVTDREEVEAHARWHHLIDYAVPGGHNGFCASSARITAA